MLLTETGSGKVQARSGGSWRGETPTDATELGPGSTTRTGAGLTNARGSRGSGVPISLSGGCVSNRSVRKYEGEGPRISAEGEGRGATKQTHVPLGARTRF